MKNFTFKTFKFGRYFENKISATLHYNLIFFGEFCCDSTSINNSYLRYVKINIHFPQRGIRYLFICLFIEIVYFFAYAETHDHLPYFRSSSLCFYVSLFSPLLFFVIRFRNASSHSVG
jgi:hypothetical protein